MKKKKLDSENSLQIEVGLTEDSLHIIMPIELLFADEQEKIDEFAIDLINQLQEFVKQNGLH